MLEYAGYGTSAVHQNRARVDITSRLTTEGRSSPSPEGRGGQGVRTIEGRGMKRWPWGKDYRRNEEGSGGDDHRWKKRRPGDEDHRRNEERGHGVMTTPGMNRVRGATTIAETEGAYQRSEGKISTRTVPRGFDPVP